jgi:hypothetical protein
MSEKLKEVVLYIDSESVLAEIKELLIKNGYKVWKPCFYFEKGEANWLYFNTPFEMWATCSYVIDLEERVSLEKFKKLLKQEQDGRNK